MENVLHVLKFDFGWVWTSDDNVNEISIWRQLFSEGSFLADFPDFFWKFQIFKDFFDFDKFKNFSFS